MPFADAEHFVRGPDWTWYILFYFFLAGLSGGSYVIATLQRLTSRHNEGAARVGSSSAFSSVVDGHQVTAVGEVPPNTVELIAKQVKASKAAAATEGLGLAPQPRRK